jgi:hypothetical protein
MKSSSSNVCVISCCVRWLQWHEGEKRKKKQQHARTRSPFSFSLLFPFLFGALLAVSLSFCLRASFFVTLFSTAAAQCPSARQEIRTVVGLMVVFAVAQQLEAEALARAAARPAAVGSTAVAAAASSGSGPGPGPGAAATVASVAMAGTMAVMAAAAVGTTALTTAAAVAVASTSFGSAEGSAAVCMTAAAVAEEKWAWPVIAPIAAAELRPMTLAVAAAVVDNLRPRHPSSRTNGC